MKNSKKIIKNLKKKRSRGLGDDIAAFTEKTGIKKLVTMTFDKMGLDCGCEARQKKLNELFPSKKPGCLNESEHDQLKIYFKNESNRVTAEQQQMLLKIHNRIFPNKRDPSGCGSCVKELVDIMRKVYQEYE